jgi:predicted dehydrogenase
MVQETKNRIADGKIGDIRVITGSYQQDWLLYDTDYSWRLEPEVAGISCAIADIGSHWMDAIQHVTGHRITEVMADLKTVRSALPNLSMESLGNIYISCPKSTKEMNDIVNYLDVECSKIQKLIDCKKEKIAQLKEYKKSLIYECVTGKKEI